MAYILGLDLGTNSIGWACIDKNNNSIVGMGSRIFPEGVNRNAKGKEVSKNATRRLARQSRRQFERKKQRKEALISCLKLNGMFPLNDNDKAEFFKFNPYEIRKRGLDEKLTKFEIGRALYHINQRRGFKSSRKSGPDKEGGKIAEGANQLQTAIDESNCRTVGEYLAGFGPAEVRIRGYYTLRSMYEHEFDCLWEKQKSFYPEMTDTLKNEIKDRIIFYQRPLKSVANLIGKCTLENDKKRCSKSAFEFQYYRILEQVNRLSFIDANGEERFLHRSPDADFDEDIREKREKLIERLKCKKEVKFKEVRKILALPETNPINLEEGGLKGLIGNRTEFEYARKAYFGKDWWKLDNDTKEKIHQVVTMADDADWLFEYAQKTWGLSEENAEKVAKSLHFEQGYANLSKKAIKKLIPYMEGGLSLSDAKETVGYGNSEQIKNMEEMLTELRNPIVRQTLFELSRLLRAIVIEHGKPERIRIELARELKQSAKQREKTHYENLERKKENEKIANLLKEKGIKPTHDSILRYKLWEECRKICPYTGDTISFEALFSETPTFQVEHIIPYPRSLDDSYMNKTLCRADENLKKRNKTPFEAYHGTKQFDEIVMRLKRLPYNKRKRFLQKEIVDDFISRQLNDTAYISKMSKNILKSIGYKVDVTKGQATAKLRHLWGLDSILQKNQQRQELKNREDHRHHAVDAAVVALTNRHSLHKLSAYNKYGREVKDGTFPVPWKSFRNDLAQHIRGMLISHSVKKRVRGQLHEDTYYGAVEGKEGARLYAVRKSLDSLTPAMIGKIADPTVQQIVKNHLRNLDVNPDAKKFTIPNNAFKDTTLYMKSNKGKKIPIKKVRIHQPFNNIVNLRGKTSVEPGNNHHVVLYKYTDKNGVVRQDGETCTLFEAVRRKVAAKPVIKRDLGEGKEFLFSLAINEMVLHGFDEDDIDWQNIKYDKVSPHLFRVQKISNQITLRHHLVSVLKNDEGIEAGVYRPTPSSFKGIKVRIDRTGKLFKAND